MLQEVVRDAAARAVASASSAPAKLQSLHHVEDDAGSLLSEISLQATAGGDVISEHTSAEHAQCHTHVAVTLETHRGYAFANLRCGHELESAAEHENTDPAAVANLVQSLFLPLPLPPPLPPSKSVSVYLSPQVLAAASLLVIADLDGLELRVPPALAAPESAASSTELCGVAGAMVGDDCSDVGYTLVPTPLKIPLVLVTHRTLILKRAYYRSSC